MIQIPVFNDTSSSFTQQITLGTQTLSLRLDWNGRGQHWFLDILQADDTPIVLGRKLVPFLPVLYSHRALAKITGDFILIPESDVAPEYPTFEGLGTTHNLYWLDAEELNLWEESLGIG